jgi:hypothetical protein
MKARLGGKASSGFQPVEVTFTFESQDELDRMFSLFEFSPFLHYLGSDGLQDVRDVFEGAGADYSTNWERLLKYLHNKK